MVNPEKGKNLNPKGILDLCEVERMHPSTLAGIMAKWPDHVGNYFRLKYAGQEAMLPKVYEWLESATEPDAIKGDWPMGKYRRLIDLAIREALVTGDCSSCEGSGRVIRANREVTCARCGGAGRTRYTAWRRAKSLGVSSSAWTRTWSDRYSRLTGLIEWAENIITYRR